MNSYVAYLRVSTQKQGQSGLEAQRAAVEALTSAAHLVEEFVEVESGKQNQHPQLAAAIALAKTKGATLLIAKFDRLSRNTVFIFQLRDAGVNFICCDMPDANTLTVGIFAVLAQHERETISKRTRDALAAKLAQGAQLGTLRFVTRTGKVFRAEQVKRLYRRALVPALVTPESERAPSLSAAASAVTS